MDYLMLWSDQAGSYEARIVNQRPGLLSPGGEATFWILLVYQIGSLRRVHKILFGKLYLLWNPNGDIFAEVDHLVCLAIA